MINKGSAFKSQDQHTLVTAETSKKIARKQSSTGTAFPKKRMELQSLLITALGS
jgi:hypothetical protein